MADLAVLPSPPPAHVMRFLRELASLEQASIVAINAWLRKNQSSLSALDHQEIVSLAQRDTALPRYRMYPAIEAVLHVGVFVEDDDKLEAVVADLKALQTPEDQLSAFRTLMEGVRFPNGALLRKIWGAENRAVPTVLNTRTVCDLRAVFDEEARGQGKEGVQKLLALLPVVIMSLDIQDESGDTTSIAVQFSASGFARFNRIMAEASRQLERMIEIGQSTSPGLNRR